MTTVQDLGRFGYYHLGIPQSGAMDNYSAQAANALVGNAPEAALLECTYMGPEIEFLQEATIAITGAPVEPQIDGKAISQWNRIEVSSGSKLTFGFISGGSRFYIAFRGGINVPVVLGSRSTYTLCRLGGFQGRKLESGDELSLFPDSSSRALPVCDTLEKSLRPEFSKEQTVRVLPGLYDHKLTSLGLTNLFEKTWYLTPVADRGGLRYDGPGVEWNDTPQPFGAGSDPSNIVDAGYAVGSIQIPGGTKPIILHRDAVSGGGYAMVGTVISADMDVISRAAPGTSTHFQKVDLDEALAARKEYQRSLAKLWEIFS
ncbi:5-oxoprolinase/urea amidolyase family protein [Corynebacterium poyangense]|uniref:5-oxoprolinase/urea amidolyase family protein n=2 Tax=Corynebacterium poyangense TaxID=2684405 RepID=A0A7H0SRD5_9CORY|nr:biotin-dependent carboxyltransferase family protein [Corynebacterium poyangense]MBZ8176544.1 5-oxoprolinase/urea amidolyase family protein [Corynebacterium poyangense]QNQ91110.1 5-oxoprolinase/urea amidolyase family protein [Corynebacterium poyangense]